MIAWQQQKKQQNKWFDKHFVLQQMHFASIWSLTIHFWLVIVVALGQQSLHTSQSPQSNGDICSFPNPIASNCALLHAEQCLFQLLQEQGQHGRTWETMLEESHGLRQDRYCNGISHWNSLTTLLRSGPMASYCAVVPLPDADATGASATLRQVLCQHWKIPEILVQYRHIKRIT